jgi:hypothetical protein
MSPINPSGIPATLAADITVSPTGGDVLQKARIHNVMKSLVDGGAIYTLCFQPGTVFRGNLIHDVHRGPLAVGAPNNGFFIDEGSKGFLFQANTVRTTSGGPVRYNSDSKGHTWKDNDTKNKDSPPAKAWLLKVGPSEETRKRWGLPAAKEQTP